MIEKCETRKNQIKITKEEHIWTSEEKIKRLGYGEWVEEIDVLGFEYRGYINKIIRVMQREPVSKEEYWFGGHLCGYIQIPDYHPYFKDKDKCDNMDCHGGITFNQAHDEHWIGFDCAHSGDYVPSMEFMRRTNPELISIPEKFPLPPGFEKFSLFNTIYRNVQFCIDECTKIVDQLILCEKEPND